MFRAFAILTSVLVSGVMVASFKSDLFSAKFQDVTRRKVEALATEVAPQMQIDLLVSQLKSMCPVSYGANVTLIDVNATGDFEITARYVLSGPSMHVTPSQRSELRRLAIEQFHSTGMGEKLVVQKIHWHFTYESVQGNELLDIALTPNEFLSAPKSSNRNAQLPASQPLQNASRNRVSASRATYPMADNNEPIRALPNNQVIDAFFNQGRTPSPMNTMDTKRGRSEGASRGPMMQRNPFVK